MRRSHRGSPVALPGFSTLMGCQEEPVIPLHSLDMAMYAIRAYLLPCNHRKACWETKWMIHDRALPASSKQISLSTVPPKCKLTLDSRFSRESRIEDRVSILDSILDTRFSQKLSTRNFPDYADSMRVARKRFISCEERTITTMHDCRSTYNPSRANVLTRARA